MAYRNGDYTLKEVGGFHEIKSGFYSTGYYWYSWFYARIKTCPASFSLRIITINEP